MATVIKNNQVIVASLARITGGANASTTPVAPSAISEKLREGVPCLLDVRRDRDGTTGALDGTVRIMGAPRENPRLGSSTSAFTRITNPGAGVAFTFQTQIAYAGFSGNNFIVCVNGVPLDYKAAPDAKTNWKVTNVGGLALITIGTTVLQPDVGGQLEVFFVTPVEILADGAHGYDSPTEIIGAGFAWVDYTVATTNLSATEVTIRPR